MAQNLEFLKTLIRPWLPKVKNLEVTLEPKDVEIHYSFIDAQEREVVGIKKGEEIINEFLKWFK